MRILHVIPSVSARRGGPSVAVRAMAESVSQRGVEVHIAATDDDGPGHLTVPLGQPIPQGGVTYWYFRRQSRFYTFSWPLTRWLAQQVAEYDLLHIHALFSYASLPASLAARRAGVPYIVRPLGTLNQWGIQHRRPLLKRLSMSLIERPLLAHAARIHYTSEQERLEAEAVGVRGPWAIFPIGVELPNPATLPPPERFLARYPYLAGRTRLLFLSRLDPKKGLELLLDAFALVHREEPETALVVAGNGESRYLVALQARAEALGIAQAVTWAGFLTGEEKHAALAAADLFVLPSHSENFGIAAVEAMAAGLPLVLSDQVAIHREVAQGGAGLITPCAVPPLTQALLTLVREPLRRAQMAQASRALAHQHFSTQAMGANLLTLYRAVVDGR